MLSIITNSGSDHGIAVRCVGYVPMLEDRKLILVEPGKVQPVFPSDTRPGGGGPHSEPPAREHTTRGDSSADRASLHHHLVLVSCAMCEVTLHSPQVSTSFDLTMTTPEETWSPLYGLDALNPALEQVSGWGSE